MCSSLYTFCKYVYHGEWWVLSVDGTLMWNDRTSCSLHSRKHAHRGCTNATVEAAGRVSG